MNDLSAVSGKEYLLLQSLVVGRGSLFDFHARCFERAAKTNVANDSIDG
jgi:hypothetical protein